MLTIACVVYDVGSHQAVLYKFKNCKPAATTKNIKVIISNKSSPSCGIHGNGMCLGGNGPSTNFASGIGVFDNKRVLTRFPFTKSSSGVLLGKKLYGLSDNLN